MPKGTISTLSVDLVGNSAKLQADLRKANKSVRAFAKKARKQVNAVGRSFTAATGVAGTALVGLTVRYSQTVDSLAKTSDNIGIATSALQGLRLAASETAGVAGNTLDTALQRFTRRLSEAEKGIGVAVTVLDELGLEADQLIKLPLEERIAVLSDRFRELPTQADRVRVSVALFGREGAALANTLAIGGDALREYQKQIKELGIGVSRLDAAKVEAANDAFARSKIVFDGFGQTLAVQVAPLIKALSDDFVDGAKESGGFETAAVQVVNTVAKGFGFVGDSIRGVQIVLTTLKLGFQTVAIAGGTAFNLLAKAVSVLGTRLIQNILTPFKAALTVMSLFSDDAKEALETLRSIRVSGPPPIVQDFVNAQKEAIVQTRADLEDKLLAPLPSERIADFITAARVEAEKAASQAANTAAQRVFQGQGEQAQVDPLADQPDAEQARLDAINRRTEQLSQFQAFSQKTAAAIAKTEVDNAKFTASTRLSIFKDLTSGLASEGKKAFKLNQGLQIADALSSTYTGAISAYKAMAGIPIVGPVLGAAAAAAVVKFGFDQVRAIKAQKFNGGGSSTSAGSPPSVSASSASAPSAAAATPAAVPITPDQDRRRGTGNTSILNLGMGFTDDMRDNFRTFINEAQRRGDEIIIEGAA